MQSIVFRIPTWVHPPGLIQQGFPATSVVIIGLSMAITLSILCNKRQSIVSAMSKQFFSTYLALRCEDGLGSMRADLTKLRQVLFNLLSNASKFTSQGTI